MRLQLICMLFMGTVIAIPYGGREVSLCCLRLYSIGDLADSYPKVPKGIPSHLNSYLDYSLT